MGLQENELIAIATIQAPRGIQGEFSAHPTTGDLQYYLDVKQVYLVSGQKKTVFKVLQIKIFKDRFLFRLEGIKNPEDAQKWRGFSLCLKRKELKPLEDDEFFIHDFIGSKVLDMDDKILGEIVHYFEAGENAVAEVSSEGGDFLFPVRKEILIKHDMKSRRVWISPPVGLVEINRN